MIYLQPIYLRIVESLHFFILFRRPVFTGQSVHTQAPDPTPTLIRVSNTCCCYLSSSLLSRQSLNTCGRKNVLQLSKCVMFTRCGLPRDFDLVTETWNFITFPLHQLLTLSYFETSLKASRSVQVSFFVAFIVFGELLRCFILAPLMSVHSPLCLQYIL